MEKERRCSSRRRLKRSGDEKSGDEDGEDGKDHLSRRDEDEDFHQTRVFVPAE